VQRCQHGFCDLGLAQVNWETWHQALQLDRRRLVDDDAYNIAVAVEILADTRTRFGDGPGWWTRYHDHRPDHRLRYGALVRAHAPALLGRI
jgi:phage gp46-like protein